MEKKKRAVRISAFGVLGMFAAMLICLLRRKKPARQWER